MDSGSQDLRNVSWQFFIHAPSQNFVDLAQRLTNKEAIPQLKAQTRSYPIPYENLDGGSNQGFEIWSTELTGSYTSPGFCCRRIYITHVKVHSGLNSLCMKNQEGLLDLFVICNQSTLQVHLFFLVKNLKGVT